MSTVAIFGAGPLGGAVAHALAERGLTSRVVLIDPAGQVAAGKALDILQAGAITGATTHLNGTTDANQAAAEALELSTGLGLPRYLGLRLAGPRALADGWGEPLEWLREAEEHFHQRDVPPRAGRCCVRPVHPSNDGGATTTLCPLTCANWVSPSGSTRCCS